MLERPVPCSRCWVVATDRGLSWPKWAKGCGRRVKQVSARDCVLIECDLHSRWNCLTPLTWQSKTNIIYSYYLVHMLFIYIHRILELYKDGQDVLVIPYLVLSFSPILHAIQINTFVQRWVSVWKADLMLSVLFIITWQFSAGWHWEVGPLPILSVATAASRLSAREFVAFFGATLGLRLQSRFKAVFGPRPRHSHHSLPRDYISHNPTCSHISVEEAYLSLHFHYTVCVNL